MKCIRCGAELRYDPGRQMLVCDHCEAEFDSASYVKEREQEGTAEEYSKVLEGETVTSVLYTDSEGNAAEELRVSDDGGIMTDVTDDSMNVIEYVCPNCGGTLYSVEEAANGFCSFCGSQMMLETRFSRMRKPEGVIPFMQTKEDCKARFSNFIKKAVFAPKEFKDPASLEKFRGIYMPYHVFDTEFNGIGKVMGEKQYRRGDYIVTDTHICSARVDAYYKGLSYDAQAAFDDHISEHIAPFDIHRVEPFNENYLAGFYADRADVPAQVYRNNAKSFAYDQIRKKIESGFKGIVFRQNEDKELLPIDITKEYNVFFPVWFLSYRKKDRVAYAVVNGQTGKLYCDLPVDLTKFILSTLLMTVLIYLILLFVMPVLQPGELMNVIQVLAAVSGVILERSANRLAKREMRVDDQGYFYKYLRYDPDALDLLVKSSKYGKKKFSIRRFFMKSEVVYTLWVLFTLVFMCPSLMVVLLTYVLGSTSVSLNISIALNVVVTAIAIRIFVSYWKVHEKKMLFAGSVLMIIGCTIATLLSLINPINDLPYYIVAAVMGFSVVFSQLAILDVYNKTTTRPLPQLNRMGGDDSAV